MNPTVTFRLAAGLILDKSQGGFEVGQVGIELLESFHSLGPESVRVAGEATIIRDYLKRWRSSIMQPVTLQMNWRKALHASWRRFAGELA